VRFALMTGPQQGMSYADQLAIAGRAESAGFEAFFRSEVARFARVIEAAQIPKLD